MLVSFLSAGGRDIWLSMMRFRFSRPLRPIYRRNDSVIQLPLVVLKHDLFGRPNPVGMRATIRAPFLFPEMIGTLANTLFAITHFFFLRGQENCPQSWMSVVKTQLTASASVKIITMRAVSCAAQPITIFYQAARNYRS
jgi:hypothetical protein